MKKIKLLLLSSVVLLLASCSTINHSMKESNIQVNLNKSDFTLSDQVTGEATTIKVLGIDWSRLVLKKSGSIDGQSSITASIPVVGSIMTDATSGYSLHELMKNNPGYDVIFYPQYETTVLKPILGLGFLTKVTKVKSTARLGKLNK